MGGDLVGAALLLGVLIAICYRNVDQHAPTRKQRIAGWVDAGRSVGLLPQGSNRDLLEGELHGHPVSAHYTLGPAGNPITFVSVAGLEPSLVLGRAILALPDLECGDIAFDEAIVVRSKNAVPTLAALDHSTRAMLEHAILKLGVEVKDGQARYSEAGRLSPSRLTEVVEVMSTLAQRLDVDRQEVPKRLLTMVQSDGSLRVRMRALATLLVLFRERTETGQAVEAVGLELVEPMLLRHLEERSSGQDMAFRALGRIAGLSAVERLLKLKCDGRMELLRGAAIAAIQARAGAGEQGWLTLAPGAPSDGALSTADDAGTLAIAEPEND